MDFGKRVKMKFFAFLIFILCFFSIKFGFSQDVEYLTLEKAIKIGLENSYEIKQARSVLAESRHRLKAWKLSYSSYADIDAYTPVYTNRFKEIADAETGRIRIVRQNNVAYRSSLSINQPILFTDGTLSLYNSFYNLRQEDEIMYQSDVTLNLNQPLFQLSSRKISLKQAELNLTRAQLSYSARLRDLKYRITEQFLYLFTAQKKLELTQEVVKRAEETYQLALKKYRTGLYSEMDLLQIEVDLSNEQNNLYNNEENFKRLLENFKLILGIELKSEIDIFHELTIDSIRVSEQELLDQAIDNNPDRLVDEVDIKLSELDIKQARASRQFKVDMNLEYGFSQIKNSYQDLFKKPEMTQIANINLVIPLWDCGQNNERVLAAHESLLSSELALKETVESLKVEIKEIFLSLQKSQKLLMLSEKTEENAQKSYRYSVMQFNAGSISADELSLARNRLNTASLNNLNAKIEYLLAVEKVKMHLTPVVEE